MEILDKIATNRFSGLRAAGATAACPTPEIVAAGRKISDETAEKARKSGR